MNKEVAHGKQTPNNGDAGEVVDISVVVPIYNEEGNVRPFLERLVPVLERVGNYEILFALDPSTDDTQRIISEEISKNPHIGLLLFSRRVGQPSATLAGILNCHAETCVVIDVDLQDPPELITEMYAKLQEGYEVVYATRRRRAGETAFKRPVAFMGYKVINAIADVQIPRNTGDFRIMTRRVIEELRGLSESHGFLRGLVAYIGFKQTAIEYERDPRLAGRGNYNRFLGSLKIGISGIVGYSADL